MKRISTYSQQMNGSDHDLYICDSIELKTGNKERSEVYTTSIRVMDNGKNIYSNSIVDAWLLRNDMLFVVHTESRDASNRPVDVMIFIQGAIKFNIENLHLTLLDHLEKHAQKALLSLSNDMHHKLEPSIKEACETIKKSPPLTLIASVIDAIRSALLALAAFLERTKTKMK